MSNTVISNIWSLPLEQAEVLLVLFLMETNSFCKYAITGIQFKDALEGLRQFLITESP